MARAGYFRVEVWLVDTEAIKPHETSGDDDVVVDVGSHGFRVVARKF